MKVGNQNMLTVDISAGHTLVDTVGRLAVFVDILHSLSLGSLVVVHRGRHSKEDERRIIRQRLSGRELLPQLQDTMTNVACNLE